MDLTIGDYLSYLQGDPGIEVYGVYAEGFRRLDGKKFLTAARAITASGRTVVFYRAGRTPSGALAAASHTASIAGDYAVTTQLAVAAGVLIAENPSDFVDLLRLCTLLRDRPVRGRRLGALSNAGFECVSIADHLGELRLSVFSETARARLRQLFEASRIDQVVDVHNPLDLTPMAGDAAYAEAVRIVLEDENVDIGLIGCVPLTAALNTLPPGAGHCEDIRSPDSLVQRLIRIRDEVQTPWVCVVDSGRLYDPMATLLEQGGIPTVRAADHALRLLNTLCGNHGSGGACLLEKNGPENRE
jgi:acyl-CoA synthetase (NDP forming)